jgi:hypothetical protein
MNLASDCNASPNLYRADHSPVNVGRPPEEIDAADLLDDLVHPSAGTDVVERVERIGEPVRDTVVRLARLY